MFGAILFIILLAALFSLGDSTGSPGSVGTSNTFYPYDPMFDEEFGIYERNTRNSYQEMCDNFYGRYDAKSQESRRRDDPYGACDHLTAEDFYLDNMDEFSNFAEAEAYYDECDW